MFAIVLGWEAFKDWLSATVHLTHLQLHLVLGLTLTVAIGWAMRVPLGSWRPWWAVFGLEMLNETSDFTRYYVSNWPWTPWATLREIAVTMLPPLMLVLAARWWRHRAADPAQQPGIPEQDMAAGRPEPSD